MPKQIQTDGAHHQVGRESRAAVVLSVMGRAERRAGRPAAGITGTMLAYLGETLALMGFLLLQFRGAFTITNAHTGVEYLAHTGRSEVSRAEVEDPANLIRLAKEIGHITDVLLVCGDRAEWAVDKLFDMKLLRPGVRIVRLRHPSLRSLNQIHEDIHNQPIEPGRNRLERQQNTRRRIQVLANQFLAQLQ